jgi:hypothetical protein
VSRRDCGIVALIYSLSLLKLSIDHVQYVPLLFFVPGARAKSRSKRPLLCSPGVTPVFIVMRTKDFDLITLHKLNHRLTINVALSICLITLCSIVGNMLLNLFVIHEMMNEKGCTELFSWDY